MTHGVVYSGRELRLIESGVSIAIRYVNESVQKLGRLLIMAACASGGGIAFVWSRLIGLATVGEAMRLIIEARLVDGEGYPAEEGDGVLAVIERPDLSLAELGLTLAEGRLLLAKVQTELISEQVQRWLARYARIWCLGS